MRRPELLIPAGNLEKLRTAILYGADAVYVGVAGLSLRARQSEFTLADLEMGIKEAHQKGVKVYAALNIFARNSDLPNVETVVNHLAEMAIDGIIASDPGVIQLIRKTNPNMVVHLSTQANTTNVEAVKFWANHGVSRIVLARELNLDEVAAIAKMVPEMEFELFIHGAMCMSYSGRCYLSSYLNHRSANQGDCSQPCRWEYQLIEATRPDVPLILEEDDRYSYFLSSKDLCMVEYLPQIVNAGISSLKVEGRMKTVYYVAVVTRTYRQALDSYLQDPEHYSVKAEWIDELNKVSNRGYTTGFYFASEKINEINPTTRYYQSYDMVGTVLEYNPAAKKILVGARNRISLNDEIELLLPDETIKLNVTEMHDEAGVPLRAAHNQYRIILPFDREVPVGAVIRRAATATSSD
ncbi:MAG TPA: U32 family peptidase [Bacillota bacterium]|jgi:putative protease|nr:U32 family peptidase [Bacillota bacterium]HOL09182.1 U32 family peptidase [Bacillota bacterium]HPO96857.1 U32 family peptidase [Bacillota bacterium]